SEKEPDAWHRYGKFGDTGISKSFLSGSAARHFNTCARQPVWLVFIDRRYTGRNPQGSRRNGTRKTSRRHHPAVFENRRSGYGILGAMRVAVLCSWTSV